MKITAAVLLCCALTGCASTGTAVGAASSQWLGKNADEFFVAKGAPAGKHQLANGDNLYRWQSGTDAIMLGTSCELQILASPSNVIKQITALNDTLGVWRVSRCAELFK